MASLATVPQRMQRQYIFYWSEDGVHHLEVIQEAHIGIAERDLPLRA